MENGEPVHGSLWYYAPNEAAAINFACFFALSGLWHLCQCYRFSSWRVTGLLPWAATLYVAGFILRALGAWHVDNLALCISSSVFLYAGPPIYELANYVILSRLLHYIPYHSPLHPGRVILTFTGISVLVETFTAQGAARAINSSSTPYDVAVGKALLKTALILQIGVMVLFVAAASRFQYNCHRAGMLRKGFSPRTKVYGLLITLYISSFLIFTRTLYRTIEYFAVAFINLSQKEGESIDPHSLSPLIRYEWFFYLFESGLMLANTLLLNWRHPAKYLPRSNRTYTTEQGIEVEGESFKDGRRFIYKIIDPFDLTGLVRGRDKKWWEQPPAEDSDEERRITAQPIVKDQATVEK